MAMGFRLAAVEERPDSNVLFGFTLPIANDEECELSVEHQIWDLAGLRRAVRLTLVTLSAVYAKTCQLTSEDRAGPSERGPALHWRRGQAPYAASPDSS